MRPIAWAICVGWIAVATALTGRGAVLAPRLGRWPAIAARLKSPTVYLFAGYLVIAGLVSPRSEGETSSPLFGLALVILLGWGAAAIASTSIEKRGWSIAALFFGVYGGAVLAAGAILLAVASPAFVPPWLR